MRSTFFSCLTAFLLAVLGSAQVSSKADTSSLAASRARVVVDGRPIPASHIIMRDGITFVDVSVLAKSLGASVQSEGGVLAIRTTTTTVSCDRTSVDGQRFSEQFRSNVAGVADEIESLRTVVLKREKTQIGPRFDAIDRKLSLATVQVQTDADMAVYYALACANNSLAIAYYKQMRGVSVEEAQKNQLDSMMCAMESKFELMKGLLLPGGSCSVFQRIEAQSAPK